MELLCYDCSSREGELLVMFVAVLHRYLHVGGNLLTGSLPPTVSALRQLRSVVDEG